MDIRAWAVSVIRARWMKSLAATVGILILLWAILRYTVQTETTEQERQWVFFAAGLLGGVLTNVLTNWYLRTDEYRRGAYTERSKAIQAIVNDARDVRDTFVYWWFERGNPVSMLECAKSIEAVKARLFRLALYHEVWIGRRGVDAVIAFNEAVQAADLKAISSGDDAEKFLSPALEELKRQLRRDLGYDPK